VICSLLPKKRESIRYSYLHPLPWQFGAWNILSDLGFNAGIAACQLHGVGKPDPVAPSIMIRRVGGCGRGVTRPSCERMFYWANAAANPPLAPMPIARSA